MRSIRAKHKRNPAILNRQPWFSGRSSRACFGLFFALVLGCYTSGAQETSTSELTFDFSENSSSRTTSLLADNFSIGITLDLPPEDANVFSGSSVGYVRRSIASIGHLADPEVVNHKFVLFRRPVQPGLTSLAWGSLQAGYGRIFTDDSVFARGNNGTAWEEPGCLYLKTRFRF